MNKAAEIRRVYARIPRLECKRLCQRSCGPIGHSREERRLIVKACGHSPSVDASLTCSLLVDGLCSAYAVRPTICRLWGTVPRMACPHGCQPERWLTEREAYEILAEVQRIGGEDSRVKRNIRQLAEAVRE